MQISEADLALIQALRVAGVLEDTDINALEIKKRSIVIACADGDRFPELYDFHRNCTGREGLCSHTPNRNGGALVLAPSSPLGMRGGLPHRECCMYEIKESCNIKDTNEVILYGHFPCAAAEIFGISIVQALSLLVEAKDYVRSNMPEARVSLFIHVDRDGHNRPERFKTYFFNRLKFEAFIAPQFESGQSRIAEVWR